jgi:hypothetical protein
LPPLSQLLSMVETSMTMLENSCNFSLLSTL